MCETENATFYPAILLIMNCRKYAHKAQQQRDTWLQQVGKHMLFFHVIGDTSLSTNWLFDENEHILYVKTEDNYVSLPKKVCAAFEEVYCTYKFAYIFKTDDDQELFSNITNETEKQKKRGRKRKKRQR